MKRAHDLSLTQVNNYLAGYIECLNVKMKNNEMKMKYNSILNLKIDRMFSLLLLFCCFLSCSKDEHYELSNTDGISIFGILKSVPECAEFVEAAQATGYDKVLSGNDIFTVLLPPAGTFSNVEGEKLKELVANHILFCRYYDENWTDSLKVRSLSGKFYRVIESGNGEMQLSNNQIKVNFDGDVKNLEGRNGVAHSIDNGLFTVPNLSELIHGLDPVKYSIFLQNYCLLDSIISDKNNLKFNLNENGEVIIDTIPFIDYQAFNPALEDADYTLLVPSDDAINAQKAELIKKNGGSANRISKYYYTRMFKNQLLLGNLNRTSLLSADTISTEGGQWVVGRKLPEEKIGTGQIASNGYLYGSDKIIYKPIAADFIDSIVYEAEWATGFEGHEKTLVCNLDNEPIVSGDGQSVNYYFYAYGLNTGNKFNILIPNVFKGLYEIKLAYKPSTIKIGLYHEDKLIRKNLNMETLVPVDPNNTDPNFFAKASVGYVYLPEDGYLDLEFLVESGTYSTLPIDKIVLVPLEF